jgi:hypothetical protein
MHAAASTGIREDGWREGDIMCMHSDYYTGRKEGRKKSEIV